MMPFAQNTSRDRGSRAGLLLQRAPLHLQHARSYLYFSLAFLIALTAAPPLSASAQPEVLVFSRTEGYRHSSIPHGVRMVRDLGQANGFRVSDTEDPAVFDSETLERYKAVIFLNTTGDVLDARQQIAFESYIRSGGGFVGIHSAADTEYDWPFYGGLIGAYFKSHPQIQHGEIQVADRVHPSSDMLPHRWVRRDEWYNFRSNPRGKVHVLATLSERTFSGGEMGHDHPIAWCHPYEGGRSWYTAGGHTDESYSEPLFQEHVLGGILYAAGVKSGDCTATIEKNWSKTVLDPNTNDPMELAVAPDGRVFYVERAGAVKVFQPSSGSTTVAGSIPVFTQDEDGLLGLTLDPNFAENGWIYLFYSPNGDDPKQHVSRFVMNGNTLDVTSEQVILEIPTQRHESGHSGGSLSFGPEGLLYISVGDDTNPFASDGYTPIDQRPGRLGWDAQKSSSNTNDLRGKILRIRPEADGSYSIPDGNLFTEGDSQARPEIYVMGNRNPFRINVDPATGWLYWGDIGPDANGGNASRGPAGHDEWNQARAAGNYGWPYCTADNKAYVDYGFASGTSGATFDCAAPKNDSPNNTGRVDLPPSVGAWIWYPYSNSQRFPEVNQGGGRTAMGGPTYHFDPDFPTNRRLPAYFDKSVFIYEWSRGWIREVKLDDKGDILKINPFASEIDLRRPMDLEIGPDGAIYMLEWGNKFGGGSDDSQLVRIDYVDGNFASGSQPPTETQGLKVYAPFPNPAATTAELRYELEQNMAVTVDLYDIAGRRVARLVDGGQSAGMQRVDIDTRNLAAGVYLYKIVTPLSSQSGELVVVR